MTLVALLDDCYQTSLKIDLVAAQLKDVVLPQPGGQSNHKDSKEILTHTFCCLYQPDALLRCEESGHAVGLVKKLDPLKWIWNVRGCIFPGCLTGGEVSITVSFTRHTLCARRFTTQEKIPEFID